MKELDNFKIDDLKLILNEDTTLKRFYPLIPYKADIIRSLLSKNIADKYACLALTNGEISEITGLEDENTALLRSFMKLHDFTERKLSELDYISRDFLDSLKSSNIRFSSEYIKLCLSIGSGEAAKLFCTEPEEARKLLCLCDLMRLPGVKSIRAELYYRCGLCNLSAFAFKDGQELRELTAQIIERDKLSWSVPLLKELKTQVAVASILPHII